MTINDIKLLRYVTLNGNSGRYNASIPDNECSRKFYYPFCLVFYNNIVMLADYSDIAEEYLKSPVININTVTNVFVHNPLMKYIAISTITLDQAQQIINKNILLFNEITRLVKENELIKQINSTL